MPEKRMIHTHFRYRSHLSVVFICQKQQCHSMRRVTQTKTETLAFYILHIFTFFVETMYCIQLPHCMCIQFAKSTNDYL